MKANERERLIELIKTNTELTNDDKSKILTLIAEQKKYGLVWGYTLSSPHPIPQP